MRSAAPPASTWPMTTLANLQKAGGPARCEGGAWERRRQEGAGPGAEGAGPVRGVVENSGVVSGRARGAGLVEGGAGPGMGGAEKAGARLGAGRRGGDALGGRSIPSTLRASPGSLEQCAGAAQWLQGGLHVLSQAQHQRLSAHPDLREREAAWTGRGGPGGPSRGWWVGRQRGKEAGRPQRVANHSGARSLGAQ